MKHNKNHDNAQSTEPQRVPVHFAFSHPTAVAVCIAGTFNDWHPTAKPMHSAGAGNWSKESSLAPGTYEYCLVVDGQWMADPLAKDAVPNPFGGRNSVLKVVGLPAATDRSNATGPHLKN